MGLLAPPPPPLYPPLDMEVASVGVLLEVGVCPFSGIARPFKEACIILQVRKDQGLPHVENTSLGPSGSVFPKPKNSKKASLIVNLIQLNRAMLAKPPTSVLPQGGGVVQFA